MKMWVIMGNDYPDSVFASKEAAERYVAEKQAKAGAHLKPYETPRIYWRSYEFEVRS